MPPITDSSDRRIVRTRRMLKEALISLMEEKDFEDITVQHIAERANINRATFYAHFEDIYALLAYIIKEGFMEVLNKRISDKKLNEEEAAHPRTLIIAVCDFLDELSRQCESKPVCRPCEAFLEANVKEVLREILLQRLKYTIIKEVELQATLLSWTIYGAAWERQARHQTTEPEVFVERVLPFITLMGLPTKAA